MKIKVEKPKRQSVLAYQVQRKMATGAHVASVKAKRSRDNANLKKNWKDYFYKQQLFIKIVLTARVVKLVDTSYEI
jgi:hypothetical protein